ncbi:hypothetical protein ACKI1O_47100, partial [Streptomyces scabiei]
LSNLSGDWITAAEATDPGYWVRHLRGTVRFADNLALLLAALHGPAAARPMPCTLVFGQALNLPEAGGPDWQALNEDFAAAVAAALDGSGRRIVTMSLPNDRIDARATGLALLQRADESGCNTLIEATVFADVEQILVLRLR